MTISLDDIKSEIRKTARFVGRDVPTAHAVKSVLEWAWKKGNDAQKIEASAFAYDLVKTGNDLGNPTKLDASTIDVIVRNAHRHTHDDQIGVISEALKLITKELQIIPVARRINLYSDPATIAKLLIISHKTSTETMAAIESCLQKCERDAALDIAKVILESSKAEVRVSNRARRWIPAVANLGTVFTPQT